MLSYAEMDGETLEIKKSQGSTNFLSSLTPRKFHWCSIKEDYRTLVSLKEVNVGDEMS
jgi:hypothetical protein